MLRKITVFLLAALLLIFAACSKKTPEYYEEFDSSGMAAAPGPEPFGETPDTETAFRKVTICYLSDEGFIVPVTKLIPWEEGIAAACLSYMVSTPENLSAARELGLSTVIPDGASLSLSIRDGNALVDISGMRALPDKETEFAMIQAIVNTMTGFPTVNTVTITRDGKGGALENGSQLPVRQEAYPLNPIESEVSASAGGSPVTLYFPNLSGALTVPVTARLGSKPNLYSTVSQLIRGSGSIKLLNCFPEGTLLLGATIENGIVTVNLSDDFKAAEETEGLFTLAYDTVWLTLNELYDVTGLRFQVNGRDYRPEDAEPPYACNPASR